MQKNLISFLDLFMKYCEHSFSKEKAPKVYSYFLEKSKYIVATIEYNETLNCDYFMEVRGLLREIEVDVFKNDIPIHYVSCPYDESSSRVVLFRDFLKNMYDFFAEKGHPSRGSLQSVRLEFDVRILSVLFAKSSSSDTGHPRYFCNNHNQRVDELYLLISNDEATILEKYGKSCRDFSREEFRKYIQCDLKLDDGQQIVDNLWYRMRND